MPPFPGNFRQTDGLSSPRRPEIPITGGGPHDYGWSIAPDRRARRCLTSSSASRSSASVSMNSFTNIGCMMPPRAGGGAHCVPCPSPSRGPRTTVDTFRKHCHSRAGHRSWRVASALSPRHGAASRAPDARGAAGCAVRYTCRRLRPSPCDVQDNGRNRPYREPRSRRPYTQLPLTRASGRAAGPGERCQRRGARHEDLLSGPKGWRIRFSAHAHRVQS